ncbi:MAG TPA: DUF3040 domain-containing protein [Kribbella sp.]
MPLSEEEQRQFEQLERALAAEDPKFVSAMRGTNVRLYYKRRAVLAGAGFILGIGVLMAGAIIPNTIIGVIGFVMMVACLYIAALSMKRISNAGDSDDIPPPPPTKRHRTKHDSSGSFMERMEDRWRRRRDEDLRRRTPPTERNPAFDHTRAPGGTGVVVFIRRPLRATAPPTSP